MSGWAAELFYAMDDLIESLRDLAEDEELPDAVALQEMRDRLESYWDKWGDKR
jgi:hypothetical protein